MNLHIPARIQGLSPRAYVLFFLLIAVAIGLAFFGVRPHAVRTDGTMSLQERIERDGASATYDAVVQESATKDPDNQHKAGHTFGDALYRTVGISGISVCDARLSYGCFHQLIGDAVTGEGLGVVAQLDELCKGVPGCSHGIGHGVLGYFGYDPASLERTLTVCDGLSYDDPMQGCVAGAYMEYNLRTMLSIVSKGSIRAPGDDVYAPCDSATALHARTCYLWLPQYWFSDFIGRAGLPYPDAFKKTAARCSGVKDRALRDVCVQGTGMRAPIAASYETDAAIQLCETSFSSAHDKKLCRGHAAAVMFAVVSHEAAAAMCRDLPAGEDRLYCEAYGSGRASVSEPIR